MEGKGDPINVMTGEEISCCEREETSFFNDIITTDEHQGGKDEKDKPSGLYLYDAYVAIKMRICPAYFKEESRALIKLGWGLSFNNFLVFFIPISMIFAIGHLGKEMLAGAGLGVSFCNLTGMVFGIGFVTACDTLCSQAYGAGNYRKIGIVSQRSLLISVIFIFPIIAIWINAERILLALGQEPTIARLAGQFIECYIPALILFIGFNIMLRYLACQEIVYPCVYAVIFATIVNAVCCYLFMYYFRLGVRGGAFAVDVAYLSLCLFLFLFICFKLPKMESWQGWSWESLGEWKQLIFLGIPSMAMISLEWWCFEIGIIAIGMVSTTEQATQIVLYHVAEIIFFICYGLAMATAVRIGNLLGRGQASQAKIALKVSLILITIFTVLMGIFVVALKDIIGYLFTKDRSVVNRTKETVSILGIVEIFDGLMAVLSGGVRGVGLQKYAAGINFIGYVCIATPCVMVLIFVAKLGVVGFWTGIIVGLIVQVVSFNILLFKSNWNRLSEEAKNRSGVFQDTTPFSVADGEVEMKESMGMHCNTNEDVAGSRSPENEESDDQFFTTKDETPELVSILTKLAIFLLAVSVLVAGIFIRIFLK